MPRYKYGSITHTYPDGSVTRLVLRSEAEDRILQKAYHRIQSDRLDADNPALSDDDHRRAWWVDQLRSGDIWHNGTDGQKIGDIRIRSEDICMAHGFSTVTDTDSLRSMQIRLSEFLATVLPSGYPRSVVRDRQRALELPGLVGCAEHYCYNVAQDADLATELYEARRSHPEPTPEPPRDTDVHPHLSETQPAAPTASGAGSGRSGA